MVTRGANCHITPQKVNTRVKSHSRWYSDLTRVKQPQKQHWWLPIK